MKTQEELRAHSNSNAVWMRLGSPQIAADILAVKNTQMVQDAKIEAVMTSIYVMIILNSIN